MKTYIIKSGEYHTIGKTGNINQRLSQYRTHNPLVELIKIFDGDFEDYFHHKFREKRIDKREWFKLSEEDIENAVLPTTIVVQDEKTKNIIEQIVIAKQVLIYNNYYNIPTLHDTDSLLYRLYPDYEGTNNWLLLHPEYVLVIDTMVLDYKQRLEKYPKHVKMR